MKFLPDFIVDAMKDGEGQPSSSRVMAMSTLAVVVLLPGLLWFLLSAVKGQLLEIPGSVTGFASASSAIALAMFAANKRAE